MTQPDWPITIEQAADRFHCGIRWLKDHAKRVGIGRRAGKTTLLDEQEYAALYASLPVPGGKARQSNYTALTPAGVLSPAAARKRLAKRKASRSPNARRIGQGIPGGSHEIT